MKTLIYPPHGVFGLGRYRTARQVEKPLTLDAAEHVVAGLALRDIYVSATLGPAVVIQALTKVTTTQEVRVIAAFREVTDSPLAFRQAVR